MAVQCPVCKSSAARASVLARHVKTKHGDSGLAARILRKAAAWRRRHKVTKIRKPTPKELGIPKDAKRIRLANGQHREYLKVGSLIEKLQARAAELRAEAAKIDCFISSFMLDAKRMIRGRS